MIFPRSPRFCHTAGIIILVCLAPKPKEKMFSCLFKEILFLFYFFKEQLFIKVSRHPVRGSPSLDLFPRLKINPGIQNGAYLF